MRLGLIARMDNTGLGYQTKAYYKWLKPAKTMAVDFTFYNNFKQNYGWYPNAQVISGFPKPKDIDLFLQDIDVVLTAETPYNFELYTMAKERGIKTVCVENPEFYDYFKYPDLPKPDKIILPSNWLEAEVRQHAEANGIKVYQIHHPVDRSEFKFVKRERKNFFHIAGKPAAYDRNGTEFYIQAHPDGRVITQDLNYARKIGRRYKNMRFYTNLYDNRQLYLTGDILVFPRRYGGNCLPLNEALSSGCPVIMPDIAPNNNLLPRDWLIPAFKDGYFTPRAKVDLYTIAIEDLKSKMDWFLNCDITQQSEIANAIANTISWETLLPKWQEVLK